MLMKISGTLCILAIGAIVGVFFVAPNLLRGGGLGILFLICPLAMLLMMFAMNKTDKASVPPVPGTTNGKADAP